MPMVTILPGVAPAAPSIFRLLQRTTGNGRLTIRRPECPSRAARPVRPLRRLFTFEMQDDHLGQKLAIPPVPLERELHVGPGRVAVIERIAFLVKPAVDHRGAVPELEETNRNVAV